MTCTFGTMMQDWCSVEYDTLTARKLVVLIHQNLHNTQNTFTWGSSTIYEKLTMLMYFNNCTITASILVKQTTQFAHMDTLSLTKEARIYNGLKNLFNKWCWENWSTMYFLKIIWFRLFTKSGLPSSQLLLITEVLSVVAFWSFATFKSRNLILMNSSKILFIFAVLVFLSPQDS